MHPTPVLLPGKSHGRRSLVGCSPWGREESDTAEHLHFHFSLSCIGEGNGNPLQCSCLENPRDGGAWWAAVYGVSQSRTRLKRLSSSSSSNMIVGNNINVSQLLWARFQAQLHWAFCSASYKSPIRCWAVVSAGVSTWEDSTFKFTQNVGGTHTLALWLEASTSWVADRRFPSDSRGHSRSSATWPFHMPSESTASYSSSPAGESLVLMLLRQSYTAKHIHGTDINRCCRWVEASKFSPHSVGRDCYTKESLTGALLRVGLL